MVETFGNKLIVTDLEHGERKSKGGIVLRNDDGKTHGIRARWARVYAKGEQVTDVEVGQWVLIEHGRWTHRFKEKDENGNLIDLWMADYKGLWAVADEKPDVFIINDSY